MHCSRHAHSSLIYVLYFYGHDCRYRIIMAALCNRAGHYIFALWFFLLSFFFSFFPRLISAVADRMYTILLHVVWPIVRIFECRSEMCCARLAGNAGRKKVATNSHLGTIAQLCRAISSQLRHVSTIGKNVKQQYLPPHVRTIW